jgi:Subtilase family
MAQHKHLFISDTVTADKFITPRSGIDNTLVKQRARKGHSLKLLQQFQQIWKDRAATEEERTAEGIASSKGTYIQFTSALDFDLVTKSLESISNGIRLLNIQEYIVGDQKQIKALVFIPHGKENYFVKKIEKYRTENVNEEPDAKPKNAKLVNSIEDVNVALLEGLWTDNKNLIPNEIAKWCEVWLNIKEGEVENQITTFKETLSRIEITSKPNYIIFPERVVVLIKANKEQLIELMMQSDLLAEFRAGQETAGFWMNETGVEQEQWAEDLLRRLSVDEDSIIKVCILDKGINNEHQLLQPILSNLDTLSANPVWNTSDHHPTRGGHGTLMAGLVGYGNFETILASNDSILITHKICSVKILPPLNQPGTPIELWGDITSQGISEAEIQNPEKVLLYCMAVTSKFDTDRGRPSSWSGAVDNLAYGDGESQRLIIISGGNLDADEAGVNYPYSNFASSIQNPAQSWNALTIGAYTEKVVVSDLKFGNHNPIASSSELSPYSTTSSFWENKWPIKPDVVFEGGNLLLAPDGSVTGHDDLDLLSTSKSFNIKPFDTINATSAATAQASWFAAKVAYLYPEAWAETIRALVVHSASWTPAMLAQMNVRANNKGDYKSMLKVFGYGVPDLEKALYSSESALTYITQETIQPFAFKIKDGRRTSETETNEIHFYSLPWPTDLLLSLGSLPVKLKITLSYFIEPGAGAIGWKDKYRYSSFGLRFDLNSVGETLEGFKKRINKAAREENEQLKNRSGSERWTIGSDNRSAGSIHCDSWEGTAADLATCNLIGVFPVVGWWRERKHIGKVENEARYSLVVSLITDVQEIDLYTTVSSMIKTPIQIRT